MADADLDADLATERYSLFMQVDIKHTFRGLVFLYNKIAYLHLLNSAIWFA